MYDPSFFFEREQFIARIRDSLNDLDDSLREVFSDIIDFYDTCVELVKEYETCFDEGKKEMIANDYSKVAKVLDQYLGVIKEVVDGS